MPGMSGENGEALRIETHRGVHVIHFNRLVTNRLVVERMNQEIHALLEAETERPRFVEGMPLIPSCGRATRASTLL